MRFFGLCLSALAAVSLADTTTGWEQTTTSVAKATVTKTVMRVVETVTATRNNSSTWETATSYPSATGYLPTYSNGTTVLGTGARSSGSKTATGAPLQPTSGAAGHFGVETLGMAAIAGIVGLAVL